MLVDPCGDDKRRRCRCLQGKWINRDAWIRDCLGQISIYSRDENFSNPSPHASLWHASRHPAVWQPRRKVGNGAGRCMQLGRSAFPGVGVGSAGAGLERGRTRRGVAVSRGRR